MGYGTKFRLSCLSIKKIMPQSMYHLDLFIYKLSVCYNKPIEYFKQ